MIAFLPFPKEEVSLLMFHRSLTWIAACLAAAVLAAGAGWTGYSLHREAPAAATVNAEMEALLQSVLEPQQSSVPQDAAPPPDKPSDAAAQANAVDKEPPPKAPTSQPAASTTIELNSATIEQLQGLPGIGESKARAIVELRTKLGRFRSVEQLTEVKGIGGKTLEKLKPYIRIDGS
jgi:competence protein ComEA